MELQPHGSPFLVRSRSKGEPPQKQKQQRQHKRQTSIDSVWSHERMSTIRVADRRRAGSSSIMSPKQQLELIQKHIIRMEDLDSNCGNDKSIGHKVSPEEWPAQTLAFTPPPDRYGEYSSISGNESSDDDDQDDEDDDDNDNGTQALHNQSNRYQHDHVFNDESFASSRRPQHQSETKFQRFRYLCADFVDSFWFQIFINLCMVGNAIVLGLLTFKEPSMQHVLEQIDMAVLVVFTVELFLHFVALGPCQIIKNGWICFDLIVVLVSWVLFDSNLSILRSFRIFRLFSLVSRWEFLKSLFEAIVSTFGNMASIWAGLIIVTYICCVLFTSLYKDLFERGFLTENYFGSLDRTFQTLIQFMTLDDWSSISREVMAAKPLSFLGFFAFIIFAGIFVLNIIVAVICKSMIRINRNLEYNLEVAQHKEALHGALIHQILERQKEMEQSVRQLSLNFSCEWERYRQLDKSKRGIVQQEEKQQESESNTSIPNTRMRQEAVQQQREHRRKVPTESKSYQQGESKPNQPSLLSSSLRSDEGKGKRVDYFMALKD